MPTLIAVGACYLDTILTVDHYPPEDEKLRATRLEKRRGGNVPNTLEVLQQLLTRKKISTLPILLAILPNSASLATQQIRLSLGPNVDLLHCFYRNDSFEAPSSYIIKSLDTDSRTLVNYNELEEMTVSEFQQVSEKLASRREVIYHFEGRIPDVTARCMDHIGIHHPEARISVEVEKANRDGLQALAQKADAVFYSKSWARAQGHVSAAECVQSQSVLTSKASHLFCTWGANGAAAYATRDRNLVEVQAYSIADLKVVDTIGAGDTFIAGVLYGLFYAPTWDLAKTLSFANELAGRKVAQHGFSKLSESMGPWLDPA